jgi:hypothetical protein
VLYNADSADQQAGLCRHRCRNPRCRAKLAVPTFDRLSAFCCTACCDSFFRHRCIVCEAQIVRKTHGQRLCRRPKCRSEFRRHREQFPARRYSGGPVADISGKKPAKSTTKTVIIRDLAWRIVAGPEPSEANLIIPLDPELAARLDRQRADLIKRAKRQAPAPLLGPNDPPVNVVGGYRFPGAPKINLDPPAVVPAPMTPASPDFEIAADLSLPPFLRRVPESSS